MKTYFLQGAGTSTYLERPQGTARSRLHRYQPTLSLNGPPQATAAHTHCTSTLSRPPSHSALRSGLGGEGDRAATRLVVCMSCRRQPIQVLALEAGYVAIRAGHARAGARQLIARGTHERMVGL